MCGIAGYWGQGNSETLRAMERSLTHRGPDHGAQYEHGPVGLAHRRLSIVDLSPTGEQPMSNDAGTITIVFNGEIYNYRELRTTYLAEERFRGTSDTEVLLRMYEKYGDELFSKLNGMFAFALYDRTKGILLLVRDPIGEKPLYWTRQGDTLIFGSELKALRAHPLCSHELDTNSIAQYLMYEYIPAPATIYKGVQKLEPGTTLTYDGTKITIRRFNTFHSALGSSQKTTAAAEDELFALLEQSVTDRMVADVPVGVFLSGGLDSSTVAYFAQRSSERQIKTFSIGFKDASFDESKYAREVALFLGTDHHEYVVGPEDLLRVIKRIPQVLDEPMADSSIIPSLILSEFTSREVKVVLGGDGADELFFGYDTFFAHQLGDTYENVPKSIHRAVEAIVKKLPVSHAYMSFDFKLKKFLSGFNTTKTRRNTYWLSAFTPEELPTLLNFEIQESSLFLSTDVLYEQGREFWDSLQMDYLKGYLAEDILVKTDRAGMAHGLEVRAPFLDLNLVNFALTLPVHDKLHGRTGKYILKEVMKTHLPAHIVSRKKKGFNIPIGSWIRDDLRELFTDTLLNGELVKSGLFKREGLAILLESHLKGTSDQRKKLWTLFTLALWMEEWQ